MRKISTPLTSGITMPMDLRASVVQIDQRYMSVDQTVERPSTAKRAAKAAARGGVRTATRRGTSGLSSATGRVDIPIPMSGTRREGDEVSCQDLIYFDELRRALMRAR